MMINFETRVCCLGLDRQGMRVFRQAVDQIGFARHAGRNREAFCAWSEGNHERLIQIAEQHTSLSGWPWSFAYRELDEAIPGMKFVLPTCKPRLWYERLRASVRANPGSYRLFESQIYGHEKPDGFRDGHLRFYQRYVDGVREYFRGRPGDFIETSWQNEGWGRLCRLLDVPVPRSRFPLHPRPVTAPDIAVGTAAAFAFLGHR